MGWALPAIPLLRISFAIWIMLPQFKGEFYLWHLLEEYIKKVEHKLLKVRCEISSAVVRFFTVLSTGALKICITYISDECIVKTQEAANENLKFIKEEVQFRITQGGYGESNFNKGTRP